MRIGEVVELLIGIKDDCELYPMQYQAIIEACNLLDRFPRMEEATTHEPKPYRLV